MTADVATRTRCAFKLLVTGPFASGTTALIRSASDGPPVTTDVAATGAEAAIHERATVAMDFGILSTPTGTEVALYGTPGRRRFAFMTDMLRSSVDAVVFVVDAEDAVSHTDAGVQLRGLARELRVPLLIAVNRCDDPVAARLLATELGALASETVVPCQLVDRASSRQVVHAAIDAITARRPDRHRPSSPIGRLLESAAVA